MSEFVKIELIEKLEDTYGPYGPQKKIVFLDSNRRRLSGWVKMGQFDPSVWVNGRTVEVEIKINGKWTNFSLPSKKSQQTVSAGSPATGNPNAIIVLEKILILLEEINKKMTKTAPNNLTTASKAEDGLQSVGNPEADDSFPSMEIPGWME